VKLFLAMCQGLTKREKQYDRALIVIPPDYRVPENFGLKVQRLTGRRRVVDFGFGNEDHSICPTAARARGVKGLSSFSRVRHQWQLFLLFSPTAAETFEALINFWSGFAVSPPASGEGLMIARGAHRWLVKASSPRQDLHLAEPTRKNVLFHEAMPLCRPDTYCQVMSQTGSEVLGQRLKRSRIVSLSS
jgi:hypothetical protein